MLRVGRLGQSPVWDDGLTKFKRERTRIRMVLTIEMIGKDAMLSSYSTFEFHCHQKRS